MDNVSKVVHHKARLEALDGWRAVAVLLVIVHHLTGYSALKSGVPRGFGFLEIYGPLGVYIFFVISGYVICSVLQQEYKSNGRISLGAFYIRRCFRILPPLWLFLLAILALNYTRVILTPSKYTLRAAAFVSNIMPIGSWNVQHTWSLSFEEQFYIVFPITLILLSPKRRWLFLAMGLVFPFMTAACYLWKHTGIASYAIHFQLMLTGAVFALFSGELKRYLGKISPTIAYLGILGVFVIYGLPASASSTSLRMFVGCPLIGAVLFYTSHFDCAAKRVLSRPPVRFVGRISYGIYLWQQLATAYYEGAGVLFYSSALCLMAIACMISFRYLETPLIRIGSRLSEAQIQRELTGRLVPVEART